MEIELLKQQVANNETYGVIETLKTISIRDSINIESEIILLSSRINRNQENLISGTSTQEKYDVEQNKISQALVLLIRKLESIQKSKSTISSSISSPIISKLPEANNLEKIINGDTLQDISWLEKGVVLAKSICRVCLKRDNKIYYGTGFIIDDYLFTNNHVLKSIDDCQNAFIELNYETDIDGKLKATQSINFDPIGYFITDIVLDITIVKLETNPYVFEDLTLSKRIPKTGEFISIIQHPQGGPKKIVTQGSQITNKYEFRVQYTSDTMRGSSGSPVFDRNWNIIAIHHKGGDLEIDNLGRKKFINQGVMINDIYLKLKGRLPLTIDSTIID